LACLARIDRDFPLLSEADPLSDSTASYWKLVGEFKTKNRKTISFHSYYEKTV